MMNKYFVKPLLLILAAILLVGVLSGCPAKKAPSTETTTAKDPSGDPTASSKLPAKYWNRDYDVAGYNISDGYTVGIYAESPADTVSSLIYSRNQEIEEKYGITVAYTEFELRSNGEPAIVNMVQKDSMTGKTPYELIVANIGECATLINSNEDYVMDFYDSTRLPYLDLSNPCWDQSSLEQLSVNNRLYHLTGDLNLTEKMNMGLLMYNRNSLQNMMGGDAEEELLDMVRDGSWTLAEMSIMVKDAASLDAGTGEVLQYGLSVRNNRSFFYYIAGCEIKIAEKNDQDIPELVIDNEKTLNVVDKLLEFCSLKRHQNKDGTCYYARYSGDFTNAENVFLNGTALFYGADVKDIDSFKGRDLSFTYGYLPYPKWNSAQKDYLVSVNPFFSTMLIVPEVVSDSEFASFGLQALGEGSPKITNQYVEINCKIKGSLDERQYEMLQIAIAHPTYDIGVIFDLGSYMGVFVDGYHYEIGGVEYEAIAVCGENNFKTLWAAYKSEIEERYQQFIKKMTS